MSVQIQIPALTQQSALERKLANRLLAMNPGLGPKSLEIANALADSGLSPSAASMLMLSVYATGDVAGRGQGTRLRWFMEAVQNRYSHKLDKIRNDPAAFRIFVADIEEVNEMRDTLNGEGITVSFQNAFLLWELGLNADTVMSTVADVCQHVPTPSLAAKFVVRAALMVKNKVCVSLESAINEMRHGYSTEFRD